MSRLWLLTAALLVLVLGACVTPATPLAPTEAPAAVPTTAPAATTVPTEAPAVIPTMEPTATVPAMATTTPLLPTPLAGTTPTPELLETPAASATQGTAGGAPAIPHPIAGRESCLTCHATGSTVATPIPASHASYTNDMCQTCHKPATPTP